MAENKYTFDNFTVYEKNHLAYAAMYEVSLHPDMPMSPLYIHGSTGLGKTHLVNATADMLGESGKASYVVVTTAERFRCEYINALRMQTLPDFYAKYECVDVLIMENFQQLCGCTSIQQAFHEIFDVLQEKNKQIILTGDVPPGHLMELNRSLLSKVLAGYIIEIQSPDFDARMEILEDEAYAILKEREFDVDEDELLEIFSFIANMETRDIRKMKGMLKRVFSYAALLDEELTFLFAERILRIQDC